MAFLDTVPADPDPLVVTIDFNTFENGDKLSTMFKSYFEQYKEKLGLEDGDYSTYMAILLNDRLALEVNKMIRIQARTQLAETEQSTINELVINKL